MKLIKNKFTYLLLFLLLLILVLEFGLDPGLHKSWIQHQVEANSDYKVTFGDIRHSILQPGEVTLEDVQLVSKSPGLTLSFKTLAVNTQIWPLIGKKVHVEEIQLKEAKLQVTQAFIDQQQAKPQPPEPAEPEQFPLNSLIIEKLDMQSVDIDLALQDTPLQLSDLNLEAKQIMLAEEGELFSHAPDLSAELDTALRYQAFPIDKLTLQASSKQGVVKISRLFAELFAGRLEAKAQVDLANDLASELSLKLDEMQLMINQELFAQLGIARPSATESAEEQEADEEKDTSDLQPLPIQSLLLSNLQITDTRLNYQPDPEQPPLSIDSINLEAENMPLVRDYQPLSPNKLSEISSKLALNIKQVAYPPYQFDSFDLAADLHEQVVKLAPLTLLGRGLEIDLDVMVDASKAQMPSKLKTNKIRLALDEYHRQWIPGDIWLQGELDASTDITVNLKDETDLLSSLTGSIQAKSSNFTVHELDLNSIFTGLEDAEQTDLLDVGSFLVTGPLGLIASQMANLGKTGLSATGGQSKIQQLLVDIKLDKGLLQTQDVAFATDKFRSVFDGKFNLPDMSFQEMQFYLLDDKQCATVQQTLNGSLNSPDGLTGILASTAVVKPFTNILSEAGNLLSECEPVYSGKVAHPEVK